MNPTVLSIITERLKADGFDALFNEDNECACTINDGLAPCEAFLPFDCEAGYMIPDDEDGFRVARERKEKES